jgi:hypothetical protein
MVNLLLLSNLTLTDLNHFSKEKKWQSRQKLQCGFFILPPAFFWFMVQELGAEPLDQHEMDTKEKLARN